MVPGWPTGTAARSRIPVYFVPRVVPVPGSPINTIIIVFSYLRRGTSYVVATPPLCPFFGACPIPALHAVLAAVGNLVTYLPSIPPSKCTLDAPSFLADNDEGKLEVMNTATFASLEGIFRTSTSLHRGNNTAVSYIELTLLILIGGSHPPKNRTPVQQRYVYTNCAHESHHTLLL